MTNYKHWPAIDFKELTSPTPPKMIRAALLIITFGLFAFGFAFSETDNARIIQCVFYAVVFLFYIAIEQGQSTKEQ